MSTVHFPGEHRPGSTACGFGLTGPEPDYQVTAKLGEITCGRCKLSMTFRRELPWTVHHREGWCALPPGAEPDPEACNDPTLCGFVVTMRGGSRRGLPDCPECLALLGAAGQAEAKARA